MSSPSSAEEVIAPVMHMLVAKHTGKTVFMNLLFINSPSIFIFAAVRRLMFLVYPFSGFW